jgi:hypothetical protein
MTWSCNTPIYKHDDTWAVNTRQNHQNQVFSQVHLPSSCPRHSRSLSLLGPPAMHSQSLDLSGPPVPPSTSTAAGPHVSCPHRLGLLLHLHTHCCHLASSSAPPPFAGAPPAASSPLRAGVWIVVHSSSCVLTHCNTPCL